MSSSTAGHTAGPWRTNGGGVRTVDENNMTVRKIATVHGSFGEAESIANARLIAAAPETAKQRDHLLETLKQIRLWLAEENCDEPLELADRALRAAGVTDVACPNCRGDGEWDEGPLSARSSAQIDPEYRQVKCPECEATGRVSIAAATGGAS